MSLDKNKIEVALHDALLPEKDQSLLESGAIKNIQIFGKEIVLDIEIENPSLHYKKKIEDICTILIHQKIDS